MNEIKGSFKDLYSGVLDIAIPCLGENVTFRPRRGGVHTIPAVYDEKAINVDPQTEEFVSSIDPKVGIKLANLPFEPLEGDRVDIGEKRFEIKDVREDGQGGAEIFLFRIS